MAGVSKDAGHRWASWFARAMQSIVRRRAEPVIGPRYARTRWRSSP
jgi:hypothetical protein